MIHARLAFQCVTLTGLAFLGVASYADGLVTVEQRIYGMDCAPCAYGTERALGKLAGVEEVTVSLNRGEAALQFADDSPTTLAEIRDVIRNNGFTPKEAVVTVAGELKRDGGTLVVATRNANSYVLTLGAVQSAWQALDAVTDSAAIEVRGEVGEMPAEDGLTRLTLTEYRLR